jgi:hypothetical protein
MVIRMRNTLTQAIFGALVLISAGAAIEVWRDGIPTESRTNYWAVRRISDLAFADEPYDSKLRLAKKLEKEFNRGVDLQGQVNGLDDETWARFEKNFGELVEIWFLDKVDEYDRLHRNEDKTRYLERQVGRIKSWPVFDRSLQGQSSQERDRLERLTQYLIGRYRNMTKNDQQRVHRFLMAVWLQNSQMSYFLPGVF